MSSKRTRRNNALTGALPLILGLTLGFFGTLPTATNASDELVQDFAVCTGRYSAAMEHAWLMHTGDGDAFRDSRSRFETLLEAVTPNGKERDALAVRIDAKMAFASLLTRASFAEDPEEAAWAMTRAATQIRQCGMLILEG